MKTVLARLVPALCFCAFAAFSYAGDFQSAVITSMTFPTGLTIVVPDDNFLVVRNFTQVSAGATSRGLVTVVNLNGVKMIANADILTAAIIDSSATISPEVINNVIVAGSAKVSVTCPDAATCFISYRVGED